VFGDCKSDLSSSPSTFLCSASFLKPSNFSASFEAVISSIFCESNESSEFVLLHREITV
jgi:hypothetical protein